MYIYAAIGDSLTAGVGAPEGCGFAPRYRQAAQVHLRQPVQLAAVGVPGIDASSLARLLQSDPELHMLLRQARIISLTIGGNDLIAAAKAYLIDEDPSHFERALKAFKPSYGSIIRQLTGVKNGTGASRIVRIANLYNPFPGHPVAVRWVARFNTYIQECAKGHHNLAVADLHRLVSGNVNRVLAPDRVHLNARGYQLMAEQFDRLGYKPLD
ncbi:SGNH/GDSL hydrolase family protein [Paenibacillus tarimensis]|uniref:SGNH/GDSL hydrolase family protein n=1 Tax=Paenibacillus tarimensis TaxID=416012 RepID=UPI001F426261|nr:SGNH/GDSL hydrolase family protein [Paenibacillus tarimensis]MCF2945394.1 SGNH/GDSL hydrolase family protein [Paenibacillus tarimensis]